MKNNNITLGILGGILAGATLGFLFATKKGAKTRKKIAEKASDFKETVKDSTEKLIDTIYQCRDNTTILDEESIKFRNLKDMNKSVFYDTK